MILRHVSSKSGVTILEALNGSERRALPSHLATRLAGDKAEVDGTAWDAAANLDMNLESVTLSVDELRKAFHRRGVWSSADMRANPMLARAAISDLLGDVVKRIIDSQGS